MNAKLSSSSPATPGPAHFRTRGAVSVLLLLAAGSALAGGLYVVATRSSVAPTIAKSTGKTAWMSTSRVETLTAKNALRDAGINAEGLAASGFSAEQTSTILAAASTYLGQNATAHMSAMSAVRTARQAITPLEPLVQAGQATEQQLSALATARSDLTSANTALASARAALFNAVMANMDEAKKASLATLRAARLGGASLPTKYLFTSRSESDMLALRDALAEARVCARTGEDVSQGSQTIIAAADEEQATTTAASGLANLNAVQAAWNAYTE